VSLSTLIATKAARIVHASQGRPVSDFSLRRAQSPFVATRSAMIGGCASTSFLLAAYELRLRATGTIPHALVQLYDSEREAFAAVAESFNRYTFLLDTYCVRDAIHTAVEVAREYQDRMSHTLTAVRLDSGDLLNDSRYVRKVAGRCRYAGMCGLLASGDLDEFRIADLVREGAPVDGFGVGTSVGVGAASVEHQAPGGALGAVYKMGVVRGREGHGPAQDQAGRAEEHLAGEEGGIPVSATSRRTSSSSRMREGPRAACGC